MAEQAGKNGSVTFTGLTAFTGGLDGWTASCELNWDSANTVSEGDSATLTLFIGAGGTAPKYEGTALVASISISSVVEGLVTATVNFQGTGAYTYTAA